LSAPGPPVVGITASDQQARWSYWDTTATLVPAAYVRTVASAGGIPVLLVPPLAGGDARAARDAAAAILDRVDALVLTGGADVDPALYGQDPHEQCQSSDPDRDGYELSLLVECAARAVPVLAICRGMQLLNVSRGGTLVQHLPDLAGGPDHMPEAGAFAPRPVRVAKGSRLEAALGRNEAVVPCHHHQAVDRVGEGLVASAWADDGVIEALEDPQARFILAVQWHPEADGERSLFEALVKASRHERAGET